MNTVDSKFDYEIKSNLDEADLLSLKKKYNNILGDIIVSKLLELPENLRLTAYNEVIKPLILRN